MTMYLVAIHRPNHYDPFVAEDETMSRDIDALNDEMVAAGVRIFVGGLQPESSAKSLRVQVNGEVLVTDGPFSETKEIVLGYYKIRVGSEAVARKLATLCPTAGYVDLRRVGLDL